ncbi:MAG: serine O-acetyltransferase, partial [Pseudomonadota bacterium]
MTKQAAAAKPQIESWDPVWSQVRREAEEVSNSEPALGGFLYASILSHARFEDAVVHRLARRLQHAALDPGLVHKTFHEVLEDDPSLGEEFRADAMAWLQRDPACDRLIEPLVYFKGYHALQTHRIGHRLWAAGRKDFALYL